MKAFKDWIATIELFWFFLFSFNSLAGIILGEIATEEFAHKKLTVIILTCFIAWSNTIMAQLKQSAKKIQQGKTLFDDSETTFVVKQQAAQQNKNNEETNPSA